jgi:hypothetical protein
MDDRAARHLAAPWLWALPDRASFYAIFLNIRVLL